MRNYIFPAIALASLLATGCFDRQVANPEVVARSLSGADRATTTFLALAKESPDSALAAFPENLGAFTALTKLSLQGQTGIKAIPASIAELKGLRMLDLSKMGPVELPAALGDCKNLRELYLSDDALAAVPDAVAAVTSLDYLNLDRNALTTLPASLATLEGLKWVRLNNNKIESLPEELAAWKNIRRLYLRGNGLTKLPDVIGKLTSLEEIDLGDNDLAELPDALFALPNLRRIDLDGNKRLAALPPASRGMKRLERLLIYGCALDSAAREELRAAYPDHVRTFIQF